MTMKHILFVFFWLLLTMVSSSISVGQLSEAPKDSSTTIDGKYIYSTGFVGATYKLSKGKLEFNTFSDCCDPVWRESGTYVLIEDKLHFKIDAKTLNGRNMLDAAEATKALQEIYNDKQEVRPKEIITEYEMQVVRWGKRIYLVRPWELPYFAVAVNFKIEPRHSVISRSRLSHRFFLRLQDENEAVDGLPNLPEPLRSYLALKLVKAKVTKIDLRDEERLYTIDKGKSDGLAVGMPLVSEDSNPGLDDILSVISVDENSAVLMSMSSTIYRLGTVVVTGPS